MFFIAFQIRDWLTVLETMLKQQVVIVGDSEDVLLLLEKQKVLSFSFLFVPVNDPVLVHRFRGGGRREVKRQGKGPGGWHQKSSKPPRSRNAAVEYSIVAVIGLS